MSGALELRILEFGEDAGGMLAEDGDVLFTLDSGERQMRMKMTPEATIALGKALVRTGWTARRVRRKWRRNQ